MTLRKKISEIINSIMVQKQQSGSIIVISAMMLPIMLACLGFAYDFGNLYMHKVRLQNIADAAALAGGRAYLESQEKPSGRDEYDRLNYPNYIGWGKEYTYKLGDTTIYKHTDSRHKDADDAADDYICKNIVNLGTTVYSDVFSHYALESLGAGSASTEFSEDLSHVGSPKIFYRIGLYEQVPLHFLPLILNRKEHRVRAGSVVLIDEGKGIVNGNTLFNQLFVTLDGLNIGNNTVVDSQNKNTIWSKKGARIKATFDGGIVFAKKHTIGSNTGIVDYFYTAAERAYQEDKDLSINQMTGENALYPDMGGKVVWDDSIKMESYVSGFLKKLSRPHVELKKNNIRSNGATNGVMTTFNTKSLNFYKNRDTLINRHYTIDNLNDKGPHYFQAENSNDVANSKIVFCLPRLNDYSGWGYWLCDNDQGSGKYYRFRTEGYAFNFMVDTTTKTAICYTYVFDNVGNQIFCDYNKKNNPKWSFYRKNVTTTTTNESTTTVTEYIKLDEANNNLEMVDTPNEKICSYTYDGKPFTFTISKEPFDLSQGVRLNEPQIKNANVFHWEQEGEKVLTLNVNETMEEESDEYNPVYIILTAGRVATGGEEVPKDIATKIKIYVNNSNYRPIIFCNLTNYEISEFKILNGSTFRGMIYSPFAKVVNIKGNQGRRTFKGNIIAKELDLNDNDINWTHHNYVANDFDLNQVSDAEAQLQEERKQTALNFAKENLKEAGVPEAAWNTPEWFGSLTDSDVKRTIISKWKEVRENLWNSLGLDMPDWPWLDGGKPTDPNQHHYGIINNETDSTGEKLRIINTRTEYTIEPYINPFNNCSLSDD